MQTAPLSIDLSAPAPQPQTGYFHQGMGINPEGVELGVTSLSLTRNGRPWVPVMGEFHYARCPEGDWRRELAKMKAGGIDVVATYVFWIHHEEVEGNWDWSGRRELGEFVSQAGAAGLDVVVRCGPWCHGEVRNGGLPDWLVAGPYQTRTDDPAYLAKAAELFTQIAAQVRGLLWKDGGPVVGIQIENEFSGPAEHLLTLKRLAREAGLDAPFYTRTGWPDLETPIALGELLPLYGAYPEGFWDRELTPMPGQYPINFRFQLLRTDSAIATDIFGEREAADPPDTERYPFLTCELGGGMMSSYHRRVHIDPADIEAIVLAKLGSGGNLPGYYMYHGGTNPEGRLSTLQESQASGYWNDLPVRNYDFQAPIGQLGQLRPHYHSQRRLHLFLRHYGERLALMSARLPRLLPLGLADSTSLRWSVRSSGREGFLFVNNHERLKELPAHEQVQFALEWPEGSMQMVPREPLGVPAGSRFIWPLNFPLGDSGQTLSYATAQLVCRETAADGAITWFFAEIEGIPAEFAIEEGGVAQVHRVAPGRGVALFCGPHRIVLLSAADSLRLYQLPWRGHSRVILVEDAVGLALGEQGELRLSREQHAPTSLSVFPPLALANDGVFQRLDLPAPPPVEPLSASLELLRPAGPLREIRRADKPHGAAEAPNDADFADAAAWRVKLPAASGRRFLLRVRYVGDVARAYNGERLLTDDFYNGNSWDIDPAGAEELLLKILPLQKSAPIYWHPALRLKEEARIDAVEVIEEMEVVVP